MAHVEEGVQVNVRIPKEMWAECQRLRPLVKKHTDFGIAMSYVSVHAVLRLALHRGLDSIRKEVPEVKIVIR